MFGLKNKPIIKKELEKNSLEFWNNVNINCTIRISDQQALEESLEENRGINAVDYFVKDVTKIQLTNNTHTEKVPIKYYLYEMEDFD